MTKGPPPDVDPRVLREWGAALADAAIAPDEATLFVLPGRCRPPRGFGARWFFPGSDIHWSERLPMPVTERERAAREKDLHRVLLWTGYSDVGLGWLLRHELEHARQFDVAGVGALRLAKVVEQASHDPYFGQRDPIECDARAAAAQFVAGRQEELARLDASERQIIASSDPPAELTSIADRVLAMACAASDDLDWHAHDQNPHLRDVDLVRQAWPEIVGAYLAGSAGD